MNGYKKSKGGICIVSDNQVYENVRFFKSQIYEWGRFRNTGSHTRTTINP